MQKLKLLSILVSSNNCQANSLFLRKYSLIIALFFITAKPIEEVTAIVHGKFIGIYEPFPLPNPDGCYKSGLVCPLAEESTYTYEYSLPVLSTYPSVSNLILDKLYIF